MRSKKEGARSVDESLYKYGVHDTAFSMIRARSRRYILVADSFELCGSIFMFDRQHQLFEVHVTSQCQGLGSFNN